MNHKIDAVKTVTVMLLILVWGALILCAPLPCMLIACMVGIGITARATLRGAIARTTAQRLPRCAGANLRGKDYE